MKNKGVWDPGFVKNIHWTMCLAQQDTALLAYNIIETKSHLYEACVCVFTSSPVAQSSLLNNEACGKEASHFRFPSQDQTCEKTRARSTKSCLHTANRRAMSDSETPELS